MPRNAAFNERVWRWLRRGCQRLGLNPKKLAARTGIPEHQWVAYLHNRQNLPLAAFGPLRCAGADLQMLSNLLGLEDLGLTLSEDPKATQTDAVREAVVGLTAAVGQLAAVVQSALDDGVIDHREHREIVEAKEAVQRASERIGLASAAVCVN